jgi:hypothetical protein
MGRTSQAARKSRTKGPPPFRLPEGGFIHAEGGRYSFEPEDGKEHPRTVSDSSPLVTPLLTGPISVSHQIVELRMCALSNHIRKKPEWWEKAGDETIIEKWREEALQQAGDDDQPVWKLTPAMVCLADRLTATFPVLNLTSSGQVCAR